MTSWFKAVCNGPGRVAVFSGTSPIEPAFGTAQDVVKDKDREKGIGADLETQCFQLRFFRLGLDSIKPVQIEIHRDVPVRDDHFLQRSGLPFRIFP